MSSHAQTVLYRRLAAVLILFIATFSRFHQLDTLPPALFHDEAVNGLDALNVLHSGHFPIFFAANNGREPLLIYLQTLSLALWGHQAFSLRLVSAFIGLITIAQIMILARAFWPRQPYRLALLAGLVLAVSYWHVHFSRLSFRAILMLPLLNLTLWAFWRGWQSGRWRYFALSGLAFGVTLYTYLPARLIPLIIAGWVVWILASNWRQMNGRTRLKRLLVGSMICALVGLVVFAPLALYFINHAADFSTRTQQVSILSISAESGRPLPLVLLDHVWQTVRLFIDQGHASPVLNLPSRPILDTVSQLGLVAGLLLALWRWRQPVYPLLLAWLAVMLLPTILSNEPGHPLRAIGAVTPVVLLTAVGLAALADWAGRQWRQPRLAWAVVATAVLLFTGITTYRNYFWVWGQMPETVKAFHTAYEQIGQQLRQLEAPAFLAAEVFEHPTTQFALQAVADEPVRQESLMEPDDTAVSLSPAYLCHLQPEMLLWQAGVAHRLPPDQADVARWLQAEAPGAPLLDTQGRVIAWQKRIEVGLGETAVWPHLISANFNNEWCLLAFDLQPAHGHEPGAEMQLILYWQRLSQTVTDYRLEITLENSLGEKWTMPATPQVASLPDFGAGSYQTYPLTLPETAVLPGKFRFRLNLLDPVTNQYVPLMDTFNLPYTSPATTAYATLGQPPIDWETAVQPQTFTFGEPPLFRLVGVTPDAEAANVTLYWQSLHPADRNYTVFVHLLDEQRELVGQHDGEPGNGRLPTSMWLPGETVADSHPLTLPTGKAYTLAVGVYDWQTGQRLPVTDASGERLADDQAIIIPSSLGTQGVYSP
ncbi:MAG: glycosyltransferase family 39 protein [Anaerolineaceae bacterium]|nr:glycosyltransferase family 39 protein [Anaerolineaceae bacterium]